MTSSLFQVRKDKAAVLSNRGWFRQASCWYARNSVCNGSARSGFLSQTAVQGKEPCLRSPRGRFSRLCQDLLSTMSDGQDRVIFFGMHCFPVRFPLKGTSFVPSGLFISDLYMVSYMVPSARFMVLPTLLCAGLTPVQVPT